MAIIDCVNRLTDLRTGGGEPRYESSISTSFDSAYVDGYIEWEASENPLVSEGPTRQDFSQTCTGIMHLKAFVGMTQFGGDSRLDGHILTVYNAADQIVARIDMLNGLTAVQAFGDTTVAGTYVNQGSARTFAEWVLKVDVNPTNIVVEWYKGGVLQSSATAANTSGGKGRPAYVIWDINDMGFDITFGGRFSVSEVIVTDGNEDPTGYRLAALDPSTVGNYDQFTGALADMADDNDATSKFASAAGLRQSFDATAYGGSTSGWEIVAVCHKTNAESDAGEPTLFNFCRVGSTDYDGTAVNVDGGGANVWDIRGTNPGTGVAWTFSDLTTTEWGVGSSI